MSAARLFVRSGPWSAACGSDEVAGPRRIDTGAGSSIDHHGASNDRAIDQRQDLSDGPAGRTGPDEDGRVRYSSPHPLEIGDVGFVAGAGP